MNKDGKLETIINDFGRGYSPASTPGMAPGVTPPSITIHHDDSGEGRKPGRFVYFPPFFLFLGIAMNIAVDPDMERDVI